MNNIQIERFFGEEDFKKIFETLIEQKVNNVKCTLKRTEVTRYNKTNNYPSTNIKEVEMK